MAGPSGVIVHHHEKSASGPHRHAHRTAKRAGILLAVVVIALVVIYLFYPMKGVTRISVPETVTLTASPSLFSVGANVYEISLASKGSQSVAYAYVNRLPAFVNQLFNVTLYEGNMTKLGVGSAFANLGLTLESVGNSSITVRITPLDADLMLAPDVGRTSVVSTLLVARTGGSTAASGTTTVSTTVASSTTTAIQGNSTHIEIMTALNKNKYYALMLNYSRLYANTSSCTQSLYNAAFLKANGNLPDGPNSYQNISVYVPYMMYNSTAALGNGNYSVSFTTKAVDPLYNNSQALAIRVSAPSANVLGVTLGGIFKGENYSVLSSGYNKALSIGGACGIVVPVAP